MHQLTSTRNNTEKPKLRLSYGYKAMLKVESLSKYISRMFIKKLDLVFMASMQKACHSFLKTRSFLILSVHPTVSVNKTILPILFKWKKA